MTDTEWLIAATIRRYRNSHLHYCFGFGIGRLHKPGRFRSRDLSFYHPIALEV